LVGGSCGHGGGTSKGNRNLFRFRSQFWVSCSTPQKSQHPGTVKCACQNVHASDCNVHVVTDFC
jgi:hypothetical protein